MINNIENAAPVWKSVMVTRHLPEELSGLETLCKNLWWCWNDNAKELFRAVDYELWHKSGHNPMVILDKVSLKRYKELAKDKAFLALLNEVMTDFNNYMAAKSERTEPSVGYFCMEYGLDTSLMVYSGYPAGRLPEEPQGSVCRARRRQDALAPSARLQVRARHERPDR